ncbi:MAG TPA: Ku protein [Nocardioidaceae bacterium]|nr:Ku protein [Nocardioidaceae bacterium]
MQAIWKGTISFGMVTIPVKLYSATQERDVSFRQVHAADSGRIRYQRVCEVDKQEVPYSDIAKGYEMPDGQIVVLTSDDFAALPLPTAKSIEVMEFVPIEQVDPIYFAKAYYLGADQAGAKPYVLLRDALTASGQCAVVKVAIRTRESLALLREKDGVLVLQTMMWPDEVRDAGFAAPDDSVEVRDQERSMAESYIATLETEFDPTRYHSAYREALEELIEAKTAGLEPAQEVEAATGGDAEVVDLVAALQASVAAAKQRRGEAADETPADETPVDGATADGATADKSSGGKSPARKSPQKKSAAKKSPAKKSPARKSTAKKSPAKKSAAKKQSRKSA